MRRLKSGDIFAINLYPNFKRYAYGEYIVVKDIPKGDTGSEVMLIYNFFTKAVFKDISSLDLNEVFIGPLIVNLPNGEIEDYTFLGNRKSPTKIDRLPYFKSCEFFFEFTNPDFVPKEWWLKDYHISETELSLELYPKNYNFATLEFSSRIGPGFVRQTILIEYAKYSHQELVLNDEEKKDFNYLMRKSAYFPPRNIKSIKEIINTETAPPSDIKKITKSKPEKMTTKSILNKSKIIKFWEWMLSSETNLVEKYGDDLEKMLEIIYDKYSKIGSESIFELEVPENNKFVLTITAEGIREVIPEVNEIIQYAPKLDNFEIIAFKQPDLDFTGFCYEESYVYSIEDFYFQIKPTENNQFNLDIYIGKIDEMSEDDINVAFMFIDAQIGELKVMNLIDDIEFHILEDTNNKIKLSDLHKYIK